MPSSFTVSRILRHISETPAADDVTFAISFGLTSDIDPKFVATKCEYEQG